MIVDFLLGVVETLGSWVVSVLPQWSPLQALYVANLPAQGGSFDGGAGAEGMLTRIFTTANYFLPLYEGVTMIGIYLAVMGAWVAVRFVMRLIPGVN